MKRIFFAILGLLALAVAPVSGHAQMPGQSCQGSIVGTTKMADDKQTIIGCLLTSKGDQIWKSTIGGSASGDWQCGVGGSVGCVRLSDGLICYGGVSQGGANWVCYTPGSVSSKMGWPG